MTQKPIYRDVWGLGPGSGYPGAFPRGLINHVKKRWWGNRRAWLFSGSFKDNDGITIDIKPELRPDCIANCEQLPFADESFDFVFLDPPYSEKEAQEKYGLRYINLLKVMNESSRVCEPGGTLILLHRMIPFYHPRSNEHYKQMELQAIVGVYTIAGWTNMRALTVWRKRENLSKWL